MDDDCLARCPNNINQLHDKRISRFRYFVHFHNKVALGSRQHFLSPYYVRNIFLRIFYDSQTTYEAIEYRTYI